MSRARSTELRGTNVANAARIAVGLVWLAGAVFNALVTTRMADPYGWLVGSPVPVYRRFFADVVGAHPRFWTVLLVIGETALGVLTLARGWRARLGLAGGALFSALLFSFLSPYTRMMGPYALLLAWLARRDYPVSLLDGLRSLIRLPTWRGVSRSSRQR